VQAWEHGRLLPLWNPQIYLGVPFLANIQAAALYPPNLILLLLPIDHAIGWLLALHLGLAGAGMYLYALQGARLRPAGSAVAGAVYMLSAYMLAHAGHLNQSNTLAWTPWLMLAADQAAQRVTPRRLAAIAVLVALVILAGHTQQAYYAFLLATIAAGARLWRPLLARRLRIVATRVAALTGAVALGAGLASLQLAATVELTGQTFRSGGLPLAEAGSFSLPGKGLLDNLLPNYLGEHNSEFAGSVGMVAIFLAVLAVLRDLRRARTLGWLALALVALLAAFGPKVRVYDLFFYALPGFDLFRVPARLLLFVVAATALLAGRGTRTLEQLLAAWRRGRRPAALLLIGESAGLAALPLAAEWLVARRGGAVESGLLAVFPNPVNTANLAESALLLGAGALAAVLALRWRRATFLAPVVVAVDLLLLAAPTYPLHPLPDSLYRLTGPLAGAVPVSLDHRYLPLIPDAARPAVAPPAGLTPADQARYSMFAGLVEAMYPDAQMADRPLDADGYDGGLLPTRGYVALRAELIPGDSSNQPDFTDRLLTTRVWHRAFLDDGAITTVLTTADQDPNPPDCSGCLQPIGSGVWVSTAPAFRAHLEDGTPAQVVQDTGERLVVRLPPGASGRLVLADSWYPGWTATADGRSLTVNRYRGALRAVDLPGPTQEVVFEYHPRWLAPTLVVTVLSVLATLVLVFAPWLPAPRRAAARPPPSAS
jgi:hypothetical protein